MSHLSKNDLDNLRGEVAVWDEGYANSMALLFSLGLVDENHNITNDGLELVEFAQDYEGEIA